MKAWLMALAGILTILSSCNRRDFSGPLDSDGGTVKDTTVKDTTGGGKGDGTVGRVPDSIAAEDLELQAGGEAVAPRLRWYPDEVPDKRFSLISDNSTVARTEGGNVLPMGAGTARITVITESGRLMETFTVTVKAKPKPPDPIDRTVHVISVTAQPISLFVGESGSPILGWNPGNPTDTAYTLASQDTEKAVIQGGRVLAKAPGIAHILLTARDGGKTASFTVTIQERDNRIRVTGLSVRDTVLAPGQDAAPLIVWTPADATDKGFTLMSADPSVVSVSEGRFRAESPGMATLMVQARDDPSRSAAFKVKVVVPLLGVTAPDMAFTLGDAPGAAALAWVPEQASDKRYTLASDNPLVADIVQDTLVRPRAAGTALITVTAADGGRTHAFLVTVIAQVDSITALDLDLADNSGEQAPRLTWYPADAGDKTYSLISSDPAVVAVQGALLKAAGIGRCVITVTTTDGNRQAGFNARVFQRKCLDLIQENAPDSVSQEGIRCCQETGKVCRKDEVIVGE